MMSYDIPTFPVEVTITSAHTAKAVRQELHNRLNALRDASEYLDVDISSHLQALQAFGRIEKAIADGKDDIGGMVITDDTIEYTLPGEGMRHLCVFPDDPSQRIAKRDAGKPEPDLSESDCFMLEAVWQNGGIRGGTDENPTITLSEEDFIKFVRGCQDHGRKAAFEEAAKLTHEHAAEQRTVAVKRHEAGMEYHSNEWASRKMLELSADILDLSTPAVKNEGGA